MSLKNVASAIKPRQSGEPEERRRGKSSDPEYRQVSAWVRKDTYKTVKDRLQVDFNEKEFSELVQELLADWLERTAKKTNIR